LQRPGVLRNWGREKKFPGALLVKHQGSRRIFPEKSNKGEVLTITGHFWHRNCFI
jgi:hypothetical protein